MTTFVWNIFLALIWAATVGPFTPLNVLIGFAIGYVALSLAWRDGERTTYGRKVGQVIGFLIFLLWELLKANLVVARYTVAPLKQMSPGIVGVPVEDMNDVELSILMNLITLTPGTLSLNVSESRDTLFIHFMHVEDDEQAIEDIQTGFARRVREVMR